MACLKRIKFLYKIGTQYNILESRIVFIRENSSKSLIWPCTNLSKHNMIVGNVPSSFQIPILK